VVHRKQSGEKSKTKERDKQTEKGGEEKEGEYGWKCEIGQNPLRADRLGH